MVTVIPITLFVILILPQATSYDIIENLFTVYNATLPYEYQGVTLICSNANSDCTIECHEEYGCRGSTIHCPTGSGSCNIYCYQEESCYHATIYGATEGNGALNVNCSIQADIARNSCQFSTIYCPNGTGKCTVRTAPNSFNGLADAKIIGGDGPLDIACNGQFACRRSRVTARQGYTTISCDTDSTARACEDLEVTALTNNTNCDECRIFNYTYSPTMDPITPNPTKVPSGITSNPSADPTSDPTRVTSYPTLGPIIAPTQPTTTPSSNPTVQPSIYPTYHPTIDPTADPSTDPTSSPSTPSPTKPDKLVCGNYDIGAYNDQEIQFEVQMNVYDGDMTFDASGSNFQISYIIASSTNQTLKVWQYSTDGGQPIITVNDLVYGQDVFFTIFASGASKTIGTYDVQILCQSDNPTQSPSDLPTLDPTIYPTNYPTLNPTSTPSEDPTFDPTIAPTSDSTADPTNDPTLDPTIDPSTFPTSSPSTPSPTKPQKLICDDHDIGAYNDQEIQFEVEMNLYDGDMTFDASGSNFQISYIIAASTAQTLKVWHYETNGGQPIVTVNDLVYGQDIFFTIFASGATTTVGTYDVQIVCQSDNPTPSPSDSPTSDPTSDPTQDPTSNPTTAEPTSIPTYNPTEDPTTAAPSNNPTLRPSSNPSHPGDTRSPSYDPTESPTIDPTSDPTMNPTQNPSTCPTKEPTNDPTKDPTKNPSHDPTGDPTSDPTIDPTRDPTTDPTNDPSQDPTIDPTGFPTISSTVNCVPSELCECPATTECIFNCEGNGQCAKTQLSTAYNWQVITINCIGSSACSELTGDLFSAASVTWNCKGKDSCIDAYLSSCGFACELNCDCDSDCVNEKSCGEDYNERINGEFVCNGLFCNTPQPSNSPSNQPTTTPTLNPTNSPIPPTNDPSIRPSNDPTASQNFTATNTPSSASNAGKTEVSTSDSTDGQALGTFFIILVTLFIIILIILILWKCGCIAFSFRKSDDSEEDPIRPSVTEDIINAVVQITQLGAPKSSTNQLPVGQASPISVDPEDELEEDAFKVTQTPTATETNVSESFPDEDVKPTLRTLIASLTEDANVFDDQDQEYWN